MMRQIDEDFKIKNTFKEQFGVYLDIPEELKNQDDARAIIGVVVPADSTLERKRFIINKLTKDGDFRCADLKEAEAMHGQMQNTEYFFYVLKSLAFSPYFTGDKEKMHEHFKVYSQNSRNGKAYQLEIYDMKDIHFYLPVTNIEQYLDLQYDQNGEYLLPVPAKLKKRSMVTPIERNDTKHEHHD